eukprot:scaffold408_cov388-Prasinococcus_capsulatus_cf.AAC.15
MIGVIASRFAISTNVTVSTNVNSKDNRGSLSSGAAYKAQVKSVLTLGFGASLNHHRCHAFHDAPGIS